MKVHVPIDIQFNEEKIKEIAEKIIERRTKKVIDKVWKENQHHYEYLIEREIRDFLSKQTELTLTSRQNPSDFSEG